MNLDRLRRLDTDAEAAIRRISIVKLASTVLIVFAVTLAAMLLLMLLNGQRRAGALFRISPRSRSAPRPAGHTSR